MSKLAIFFINAYQIVLSPILHSFLGVGKACRFNETCSDYAKRVIEKEGFFNGGLLALKRLLSCHPFANQAT
jgi:uncharacterized protein